MSTVGLVIAGEVPTSTALLGGGIGYLWRTLRRDNDRRDTDLARQSEALAVLVAAQRPNDDRLSALERRTGTLSEATAGLAATLDAHERWHERRAAHPHGGD